jgi:5-methylcytosine-specific restriction endonuclease McrA
MNFQYKADLKYFADLLANGNIGQLKKQYKGYFDFRDPLIKRKEFNLIRGKIFKDLIKKYRGKCQLKLVEDCSVDTTLVVDHFIPLSSNILNKKLRKLKAAKGKKVLTQSFGSNNPANFVLACAKCNSNKKHRIIGINKLDT